MASTAFNEQVQRAFRNLGVALAAHRLDFSHVIQLTSFQPTWESVRQRAGLEDVQIHDLRHRFASRALAVGESLPMIGKLLGHTQVQTTARYAHLQRDSIKASASRIAGSIRANIRKRNAEDPKTLTVRR